MKDLVSICIPTYNGAKFIGEALQSVVSQTYKNFEVIISDDDSKDDTLEIIENFKRAVDFPVRIYKHKPSGIGANWNNCLKYAKGKYIKFLFQDDVLKPRCLEKMVEMAAKEKEIGMVYCRRSFLFNHDKKNHLFWVEQYGNLHKHWKNINVKEGVLNGKSYLKDPNLLKFPDNKIGEPTAVLIKKSVFNKIGYFSTDLVQLLDVEFWYRIMKCNKIGFIDEELVYFRLHEEQATRKNYSAGINDYHRLSHIFYHDYYKYLHPVLKWKLIWKVTRLRKIVKFFK